MGLGSFVTALVLCTPCACAMSFMFNPQKTVLLSFEAESAKNRPVSKVITLLKDMTKQLEREAEEDEEIYGKMSCWCVTNNAKRSAEIKSGQARITRDSDTIDSLHASSAKLSAEKKRIAEEVREDQKALDSATSLRVKEMQEFKSEEQELLQSIEALQSAVGALSKHNSMLQMPATHMAGVATSLQHLLAKHSDRLTGVLTPTHRRVIGAFIQSPSYAPQSSEIFGVLQQMQENFEKSLASAQSEETENQRAFEDLKAAKTKQIEAGQAQVEKKTQELADTDEKRAVTSQDKKDTMAKLEADQTFLGNLKERCRLSDQEYTARQKTRQLEMEAVAKALEMLTSDDAQDLLSKTFNPDFLQMESKDMSERRAKASALLKSMGVKYNHPRLSSIAMRVKLDAFTKVKESIAAMVTQLQKEKEDEIKHKDFCVAEFNKNSLQADEKQRQKAHLSATMEDIQGTINSESKDIAELKASVADLQAQLQRATEEREKQKQEFKATVADQRATQNLLKAALSILQGFYTEKAVALLQTAKLSTETTVSQAPPPGFKSYKKSGGAGGVMGMIEQILSDAKAMEAEAIRDEEDAEETYQEYAKDTANSIKSKSKAITHKSEIKAKNEADFVEAQQDKEGVMLELEQLANDKAELHSSCDFVVKNFEMRQEARDEEVQALKQAEAILSGAKFAGFLQRLRRK